MRLQVPRPLQITALAVLALVLRLLYVHQVAGTALVVPADLDPGFYYDWAKEIASGSWIGATPFVQSPLYAYLLGVLMKIIGPGVGRILVTQSLLGTGTVLLTYWAGLRLFDHTRGLLAGLLIALYGPFLFYEGMVMKTFLSPLLTVLLLVLLDRARECAAGSPEGAAMAPGAGMAPGAARAFAMAGLVYGLLTLDRDNFILLAPILALLAWWLAAGASRRGLRAAAAFTLGAVAVIAPVTLRNWAVSKEFVLLTTGGGEVFFIGNNADANGLYVPPPFVRPDPRYEHADFIARASEISGHPLTPMQSSWFWFRQGMEFITGDPLAWIRLLGQKMMHFWNFFEVPDNLDYEVMQRFSPLLDRLNFSFPPGSFPSLLLPVVWIPVRLHLVLTFGTLAPLGLVGLWLSRRSWRRLLPLYVLLFGYMGTVLLFFNFSRFRVPVVPLLALPAAETLMAIGRFLRRLWDLAVAFASRSGEMAARARALRPGRQGWITLTLLLLCGALVNAEIPRGVVPALEQALIIGNTYYAENRPTEALNSYMTGLILLGEGPPGQEGDALLRRIGAGVSRGALAKEVEVEAVARGPQFKGIHLGIHHGIGLAFLQQAENLLESGNRAQAMPLLDRAIGQFQEALKISPSYLLSQRKLARAYAVKGDTASAVDGLQRAVDQWPQDPLARLDLAELLYKTGDFGGAMRQLDELRKENTTLGGRDLAQIFVNRGLIFSQAMNQPGRALYCFEKALEIDPHYPDASEVQAQVLRLRAGGYQPLADDLYEAKEPRGTTRNPGPGRAPQRPAPAPSGG
jgi:tetratricopeptide (TPR) repeat protein